MILRACEIEEIIYDLLIDIANMKVALIIINKELKGYLALRR